MQAQEEDTEYGLDTEEEEEEEYGLDAEADDDITENPIDADTESRLLYGDTHADTKPVPLQHSSPNGELWPQVAYRFTLLMFGGAGAVLLLLSLMVVPWR